MVWAISPDEPQALSAMVADMGLEIPMLVDADLATIEAWGVLNPVQPTVPHPAVVVVDREGVVRFVHVDEDYRRRPAPERILDALNALNR